MHSPLTAALVPAFMFVLTGCIGMPTETEAQAICELTQLPSNSKVLVVPHGGFMAIYPAKAYSSYTGCVIVAADSRYSLKKALTTHYERGELKRSEEQNPESGELVTCVYERRALVTTTSDKRCSAYDEGPLPLLLHD